MIAAHERVTLGDLVLRGELDGYERVLSFPTCPECHGLMARHLMVRPKGFLRGEDAKIVYECRNEWCAQVVVVG